jgi:hypothetical protein
MRNPGMVYGPCWVRFSSGKVAWIDRDGRAYGDEAVRLPSLGLLSFAVVSPEAEYEAAKEQRLCDSCDHGWQLLRPKTH